MYIELFILDNLLMNLLILRLGAALLSVRPPLCRQFTIALVGAVYAALAASPLPILASWWTKPFIVAFMALEMPVRSLRGYAVAVAAVFSAACFTGGAVLVIALMSGGGISGGLLLSDLPLRAVLIGSVAATFLPRIVRTLLARRVEAHARLRVEHRGIIREFDAMIDSGNRLHEPVTGRPVAVVHCPVLKTYAKLPIPCTTAAGGAVLMSFKPDRATVDGVPRDVIIAVAPRRMTVEAILPAECGNVANL